VNSYQSPARRALRLVPSSAGSAPTHAVIFDEDKSAETRDKESGQGQAEAGEIGMNRAQRIAAWIFAIILFIEASAGILANDHWFALAAMLPAMGLSLWAMRPNGMNG